MMKLFTMKNWEFKNWGVFLKKALLGVLGTLQKWYVEVGVIWS
jgi:hypothetical protein